eukprot:scaffold18569_cov71-Phaeocystis_antarctica.AAC.2
MNRTTPLSHPPPTRVPPPLRRLLGGLVLGVELLLRHVLGARDLLGHLEPVDLLLDGLGLVEDAARLLGAREAAARLLEVLDRAPLAEVVLALGLHGGRARVPRLSADEAREGQVVGRVGLLGRLCLAQRDERLLELARVAVAAVARVLEVLAHVGRVVDARGRAVVHGRPGRPRAVHHRPLEALGLGRVRLVGLLAAVDGLAVGVLLLALPELLRLLVLRLCVQVLLRVLLVGRENLVVVGRDAHVGGLRKLHAQRLSVPRASRCGLHHRVDLPNLAHHRRAALVRVARRWPRPHLSSPSAAGAAAAGDGAATAAADVAAAAGAEAGAAAAGAAAAAAAAGARAAEGTVHCTLPLGSK